ncbi:aspartyl protease family protein [Aquimarina sp. 2201CG14-23]|uniref:aspartyl protease family protein n=1 Tax=Aquimarina mycalae TaxID=3040073 RepID=UPI002477EA35|nr:aspartyl protease family protein [Aquimarina sp. 2201CG14-23]MDH7445239.1 aspartyl protease family protein [Aquimarina sp. 2201CG14-23]
MNRILFTLFIFIAIAAKAQVETIPFEEDQLVFIKVKINNTKESLNFVFDTGASTGVLDSAVAKRLGVTSNYSQVAQGANGSETYNIALNQTIRVGSLALNNSNLVLVDLQKLSERSGRKIEGIIGYDILKQYSTRFDFENNMITLYDKDEEITGLDDYVQIPLKFDGIPIPQIDLTFTLRDGSTRTGNFLFDSGANMTLLFNTPYALKNDLKNKSGKTVIGKARGLNKSTTYTKGTIEKLRFNGFEFDDLPVDISEGKEGVSGSNKYAGILGAQIINRFDMVLDYKNKLLFVKPNSKFDTAFDFPMSGLGIEKVDDKILVSYVLKDSQAYQKGIREGDELINVDNYDGNELNIWRKYLKEEQKEVKIKVKDTSGKVNQVVILLKRLI